MASYVVLFRAHFWDDQVAAMAARARERSPGGAFLIAADETRGTLDVGYFAKLAHTEDFAALGLPNRPEGRVLWWNADYVLYTARQALPGFDYYVMLEYDVFVAEDIGRMVGRCAAGAVDLVLKDRRRISETHYWYSSVAAMTPEPVWGFAAFLIVSGRAVDAMLEARRALAARLDRGEPIEWPYCETFIPTALALRPDLVSAELGQFTDARLCDWRPYLSIRDPRLAAEGLIAHPVLNGRSFVRAYVADRPPEALIAPDGTLCPALQTEDAADLAAVFDAAVLRDPGSGLWRLGPTQRAAGEGGTPQVDLAFRKPAGQSSLSPWSKGASTAEDAGRAVCGVPFDDCAFHTAVEAGPWWQVDLLESADIAEVEIVNRAIAAHRMGRFRIDLSPDGAHWTTAFSKDDEAPVSSDAAAPFVAPLAQPARGRYLRIVLTGTDCLHLRRVRAFGTPAAMEASAA